MAKLILKGLIKKRWMCAHQFSNLYSVQDYNSKERRVFIKTQQGDCVLIFGYYQDNAWYSIKGQVIQFSKYFLDWQNPTKNEIVLFELETGLMYVGLLSWIENMGL